jgi:hypothetical protein
MADFANAADVIQFIVDTDENEIDVDWLAMSGVMNGIDDYNINIINYKNEIGPLKYSIIKPLIEQLYEFRDDGMGLKRKRQLRKLRKTRKSRRSRRSRKSKKSRRSRRSKK